MNSSDESLFSYVRSAILTDERSLHFQLRRNRPDDCYFTHCRQPTLAVVHKMVCVRYRLKAWRPLIF
jgi:hypothetical protein